MKRRENVGFAVACALACMTACGAFSGSGGGGSNGASDGGPANESDGSSADGGGGGPNGGMCEGTLYVSPMGDDKNDGCSIATPKKTIGNAILAAEVGSPRLYEIHACAGTYDEAIELASQITLRGSYDCKTFTRATDAGAGAFVPTTKIAPSVLTASGPVPITVNVITAGAAAIDEIEIDGADVAGSTGLHVGSGATPAITDAVVRGGNGHAIETTMFRTLRAASIAMLIEDRGGGAFTRMAIYGGAGQNDASGDDTYGSVGLYASDAAPFTLRDSIVDGGSGTAVFGSSGMVLASGPRSMPSERITIATSRISGGAGKSRSGAGSIGAIDRDLRIAFTGDTIAAGEGTCTVSPCFDAAIFAENSGPIAIEKSRVVSGSLTAAPTVSAAYGLRYTFDPRSGALGAPTITNDTFFVGGAKAVLLAGVRLEGSVDGAQILASTFVSATAGSIGVSLYSAPSNPVNSVIDDDLFGGLDIAIDADASVALNSCGTGNHQIDHDAFVAVTTLGALEPSCNAGTRTTATLLTALPALYAEAAANNVRVTNDCGGDDVTRCVVGAGCAQNASACFRSTFAEDATIASLLAPPIMSLDPNASCLVIRGGATLMGVTDDELSLPRNAIPTIGAIETASPSCP